jgi:hypothetical protein
MAKTAHQEQTVIEVLVEHLDWMVILVLQVRLGQVEYQQMGRVGLVDHLEQVVTVHQGQVD